MCQNDGGNLVSVKDGFEQSFLQIVAYLNAAKSLKPWIGLNKDDSGVYKWSDGRPVYYINWAEGKVIPILFRNFTHLCLFF